MEFLAQFADIALHLDRYLAVLVQQYGPWIYAILFLVIFSETGLVVAPFLPGDSLLFVAGAIAAVGGMDLTVLMAVLSLAAILGNTANYAIGRYLGYRLIRWNSRLFNRAALEKTQAFYARHGGKTIVISRFLPLFRTFAPFVAGIGEMGWVRFSAFNVAGGVLWVTSLCAAGYWLGNRPYVKENLTAVTLVIIAISLLPAAIGAWHHWRLERNSA